MEGVDLNEYIVINDDENSSVLLPRYLDSDTSLSDQESEMESEEDTDSEDPQVDNIDYSSVLDHIDFNVNSLTYQIDNLNNNLVTLDSHIQLACGLLFCLVIGLVINFGIRILNHVLGLGSA